MAKAIRVLDTLVGSLLSLVVIASAARMALDTTWHPSWLMIALVGVNLLLRTLIIDWMRREREAEAGAWYR